MSSFPLALQYDCIKVDIAAHRSIAAWGGILFGVVSDIVLGLL